MTDAIVAAINLYTKLQRGDKRAVQLEGDPLLDNPAPGLPISHGQIIAISKCLRKYAEFRNEGASAQASHEYHLDRLLRGSRVYVEREQLKPPKTPEYIELMARLRREEETRSYEKLISLTPALDKVPHQRFAVGINTDDDEADEVTYADVNRQMALIINILISVVACSVALWMAASHWSTPKRLGLSMGGSGFIGIAEVVVYAGYLRRLQGAKDKGKQDIEVKEIIKTWVIGGQEQKSETNDSELIPLEEKNNGTTRRRNILTDTESS